MSRSVVDLNDKVALVTGAAGAIGGATAKSLATRGARVLCTDIDQQAAVRLAADIGAGAKGFGLDVSDLSAVSACFDEVEKVMGPLDIVANVAGMMPIGPFHEESQRATDRILSVNLRAVIHSTQEAARRMIPRGTGHILNVASAGAWIAGGGGATYCASKFGVLGYSEAAALELRGTGVELSVIAPAIVESQLSAGLGGIRGARTVTASDVARGVIDTLQRPKFVTFVPKSMGVISLIFSGIPYSLRHRLERALKTDKLLLSADMGLRADYEATARGDTRGPSGSTVQSTPVL